MKVALYARYSSDNQRDASIADQLRVCRTHAEKQGWSIVEEYTDHAISGASLMRPGIQALIADAQRGRFQIVLAEAMDRLSRDQEDIAGVFKRMNYAGVRLVTLSEGEVSHLHVGLKGTMNALFLKDLAEKTHRGLRGRVELSKSGGGNAYGYDVVRKLDASGEPIRGDRTINPQEADVVRRIFRDFAAGLGPRTIAFRLNDEGISAPGSGAWGFSTITGNRARGTGILNNEMYVGRLVWNRQRFIKDPDTGKRQARLNPDSEWVIQEVPELRIVDQELWDAVKARQASVSASRDTRDTSSPDHFREKRRPRYLFSGLSKCGCCGGRLFHDLRSTARLLDGAQQGHLPQPDQYASRGTGAARARRSASPSHGSGAVRRVLHRIHHRDKPVAHGGIGRHRRSGIRTEAGRTRYPAADGSLPLGSHLDRDGQGARIEARSSQGGTDRVPRDSRGIPAPAPSPDGGILPPATRAPARHAAFRAGRETPGGG